jgi:predicted transcriptional regulator
MSPYKLLKEIGLSQLQIQCYRSLFEDGSGITADELAVRLGKTPAGIYRQLRQLQAKGFIEALKTDRRLPTYLYAIPIEHALERMAQHQRHSLSPLIEAHRESLLKISGKG